MKTLTAILIAIMICSPIGAPIRNYTVVPEPKVRRWKNSKKIGWRLN